MVKALGVSDIFNISNYSHSDPVNNTIRKYENHSSLKKRRETITLTPTFHFTGVDKAEAVKSIGYVNSSKLGTFKTIPTKCVKVTSDICSTFLASISYHELFFNKKIPTKINASRNNTSV